MPGPAQEFIRHRNTLGIKQFRLYEPSPRQVSATRRDACVAQTSLLRHNLASTRFPSTQQPKEEEQRDERKREEERTTAPMNEAMNHLRSEVNAKRSDRPDPKSIAQNPERNDKTNQKGATPPVF